MIVFPDRAHLIVFILVRLVILIAYIFFLINLQKTLKSIAPRNRKVEPELVWLSMIPIFNFVWPFILNIQVSRSIKKEMEERQGISAYDSYALPTGIAYPSLMVAVMILSLLVEEPFPYAWTLGNMATLLCLGVFWYQTAEYRKEIREFEGNSAVEDWVIKNDQLDGF